MKRLVVAGLMAALLAGCSSIKADVTTFRTADVLQPNSFNIVPRGELADTLEAQTYADMVAGKLSEQGWTRTPNGDVTVSFGFAIDDGTTTVSSRPIIGQTGGGTSTTFGTVRGTGGFATYSGTTYQAPTYGVVGAVPVTETNYERVFVMNMYQTANGKRIYESTVRSTGSNGSFSAVAQCLVDALFQDFPGEATALHKSIVLDGSKCVLQ